MRTLTLHFPDEALPTLETFLTQTKEARGFRRAQAVREVIKGQRLQTVSDTLHFRDPRKINHSRVSNWGHNIHKPFSQGRQPLELSFYLLHRILGSFHTRLIGGSHEVHDRVPALPSHG